MISEEEAAELEKQWHQEMLQIYADAKAVNYEASGLMELMSSYGGLVAAKKLINMGSPSDGFTTLWELERLDISVEARALKPMFRCLFSETELARCRKRLADYQWTQQLPWAPPSA
jgi:hypothetical protein